METLSSKSKLQLAQERVARLRDFYNHLAIFVVVMTGLVVLNLLTSSFLWVVFPLMGWGLGILGHAATTFNWNFFFGKNWEKRQIRKFMNESND